MKKIGVYNAQLAEQIEEWKHKYFKLEEECCELKKRNKTLENDKVFHVNEIQKRNSEMKVLENEVKELKGKLEVATAMVGIKNEVIPTPVPNKRGRKKGVVNG
ncbi:hypothetical protein VSU16_04685 [Cetobacterium somerae]|uniref:hypothetical protein n=1 Tax=Cetobacterium somerae TaxID=188913 RepID=UPI002E7BA37F|nr:hypothetical protein [Cetobacterium somerae]WVJ02040.1 hypothetical protein VSU16_04685 [Cetobacterium somerae]